MNLYFRQLGTQVTVPRGYGDKIKIPRWDSPITSTNGQSSIDGTVSAVIQSLGEGGFVSAHGLSAADITGQVVQFAGARGYTDKLIIVTKANFLEGALETLGRELAFRFDTYTRTNISANGTVRLGTHPANSANGSVTTSDFLMGKTISKIAPFMDANNVPRWEDESFVAVANPIVQYDIFRDSSATGFVPVARYNDAIRIYRGEVGQLYGVRFLLSNAVPLTRGATGSNSATTGLSGGATGAQAWVFAPDAFYSIELEDGGIEVIHHPPGSGGATGDPGNTRGSIATKAWYGVAAAPSADQRLMLFAHGLGLRF